jgi:ComF family protein
LAFGLESLFFPSLCRACGAELDGRTRLLCRGCRAAITAPFGADPFDAYRHGDGRTPRFARHSYDGPAGEAVRLLKFGGKKRLAPLLAEAVRPLAVVLKVHHNLNALVPVPLHPLKWRERQFNQAEAIGSLVAALSGLTYRPRGLARVKYTRPQVELSGEERLVNVRGAFAAREDFSGERVLLLDDVVTTGATVNECGAVLCDAGAGVVVAVAAAGAGM